MTASAPQFDKEHQEHEAARNPPPEETQPARAERGRDDAGQKAAQEWKAETDMDA
jgi:hypothetical protein